jgi:hypothetical protein
MPFFRPKFAASKNNGTFALPNRIRGYRPLSTVTKSCNGSKIKSAKFGKSKNFLTFALPIAIGASGLERLKM